VGTALAVIIPEGVRSLNTAVTIHSKKIVIINLRYLCRLNKNITSVVTGVVIFSVSVSALSSTKKDDAVTVVRDEHTSSSSSSSSDIHTLIGISLVLGFVFMLLVDQCSVSRSKGK
jgi:hypothetical protein